MPLPSSATFDVFDWNYRAEVESPVIGKYIGDTSAGLLTGLLLSGATGGVSREAREIVFALPGIASASSRSFSGLLPTPVASSFTFEFELKVSDALPDNWSDVNHRVFIGIKNKTGYGAGVLVTKRQLLLATSIDDADPVVLHGSAGYLYDDGGTPARTTVRVTVDAAVKRVAVYIGASDKVYDADLSSQWRLTPAIDQRYNLPVRNYTADTSCAVIAAAVPAHTSVGFSLYSLRLSSSPRIPSLRPVAVISGPTSALVGGAYQLSGGSSFDRDGLALQFHWSVASAPLGSAATLQAHVQATATTVVNSAPTISDLQVIYLGQNKALLKVVNPGTNNAALSYALTTSNGVSTLTVSCATSNVGAVTTTPATLISAFTDTANTAYLPDVADQFVLTPALLGASGDGALVPGTYPFTETVGSNLANPLFAPDVPGAYTYSLRVSNGVMKSEQALHTVSVADSYDALGKIPDTEFVWKYLPDFWSLVQGRETLTTAWSAVAQAISGEMLKVWQNDYSKSIRDISRKYLRKWLSYEARVTLPETVTIAPGADAKALADKVVTVVQAGTSLVSTLAVSASTVPVLHLGKVLCRATGFAPRIVEVTKRVLAGDSWQLTLVTPLNVYEVIGENSAGEFIGNTENTVPPESTSFFAVTYPMPTLLVGDKVRVGTTILTVATAAGGITKYATLSGPQLVNGLRLPWTHLRPVEVTRLTAMPHLQYGADALAGLDLAAGDLAHVTVNDPSSGALLTLPLPILAVDSAAIFVDWALLTAYLNAAETIAGTGITWTDDSAAALTTQVAYVTRTQQLPAQEDLVSVPRLGTKTVAAEYTEGHDYEITSGSIKHRRLVDAAGRCTAGSTTVSITDVNLHGAITPGLSTAALHAADARLVWLTTGPSAGFYGCSAVNSGAVQLAQPAPFSGPTHVVVPRFSALNVPPARFWAEASYFDNHKAIENNFGLYVGLPKQLLVDSSLAVDYLTVVRSLVFAFMSGPHLDRLGLVADAFAGLPFTEHEVTVLVILPPTEIADGQIIARDQFNRNVVYKYPRGSTLALDPATEEPIVVGAELPAYTRLLNAVRVEDYVSDPDLVQLALEGRTVLQEQQGAQPDNFVQRYRTFVVDVPIRLARSTAWFSLLKTYLRELKPAHTDFILTGSYAFEDLLLTQDTLDLRVTLRLRTVPHSPALSLGPNGVQGNLYPRGAIDKVFADGVPGTQADVIERYESWFEETVLDDTSGDGSFNLAHKETDRVNALDNDDIDVINSLVWVPVSVLTDVETDNPEFIVGEEIVVFAGGAAVTDSAGYFWQESPPVIVHVGLPSHPKIAHDTYAQQHLHPYGYLILGFNREQSLASHTNAAQVKTNYGDARRLDGVRVAGAIAVPVVIQGAISGARAQVDVLVTLSNPDHAKYFYLDRMYRADKCEELNPQSVLKLSLTSYVPRTGVRRSVWEGHSPTFAQPAKQLQQPPYDSGTADNEQFAPSFGPGLYTSWANSDGTTDLSWGYDDVGPLPITPTAITGFNLDPVSQKFGAIHAGMAVLSKKRWHLTHGMTDFKIPPPVIELLRDNVYGYSLRVEGYYFVPPDPTQQSAPGATSSSFTGDSSGSWVFVADSHDVETAATAVEFEVGKNVDVTVLRVPGADQTSTGHVLNVTLPGLEPGDYRVIVRQYRVYKNKAGGTLRYHMDVAVSSTTVTL